MGMNSDRSAVNDTAYWMAACRAVDVKMSGDEFAHLWLNEASRAHHAEYVKAVTPMENVTLSLRHRFFLEATRKFFADQPNGVFVNIGAGFTSYPFLLHEDHLYIEVDSPDNVRKKQERIDELYSRGKLPHRKIIFLETNLANKDDLISLEQTLNSLIMGRNSFFLMEGLLYYLPCWSSKLLVQLTQALQSSIGCQLGLVTWDPGTFETTVYKRFENYLIERGESIPNLICHNHSDIPLQDSKWKRVQMNYKEIAISLGYNPDEILSPENEVFWEMITHYTKVSE